MADRAYDKNAKQIFNAREILNEDKRKNDWVCVDKKCNASMYYRKRLGIPEFCNKPSTPHHAKCDFNSHNSSKQQPAEEIFSWFEDLLGSPNPPKTQRQDPQDRGKAKVSSCTYKGLSKTARAIYHYQRSKDLSDYIDFAKTVTIGEFCISSRTINKATWNHACGLRCIIGDIVTFQFGCENPYMIITVNTKEDIYYLNLKLYVSKEIAYPFYQQIVNKHGSANIQGARICAVTKLYEDKQETPIFKHWKQRTTYSGCIEVPRQLYAI